MNTPNHWYLIGNLTKDPELKETSNGSKMCQIGLATTESVKVDDSYEDKTVYYNIVVFGKMAETMSRFLTKGSKIYIDGNLTMSEKREDRDGNTVYPQVRLNVRNFSFLDSKKKSNDDDSQPEKKASGEWDDMPFD